MTVIADISLEAILAKLRALEPAIRAHGVARLAVFGSRARGDARPDSDLDILIDRISTYDDDAVAKLIENATGLSIQISIRELLKPRIIERIADDVTEVFLDATDRAGPDAGCAGIHRRDRGHSRRYDFDRFLVDRRTRLMVEVAGNRLRSNT